MATAKRFNVYVIELDKSVLDIRRFIEARPGHDPGKACFYVGTAGLDPDDRFEAGPQGEPLRQGIRPPAGA